MPYQSWISRKDPGCMLVLVDQSASMLEPVHGTQGHRKCDQLALAMNSWLQSLVVKCTVADGVRDYIHLGVCGYRTDPVANPIVESWLKGPLSEKPFVAISEIHTHVARIEAVNYPFVDPDTGELQEIPLQIPIWVDPVAEGGTPLCSMLYHAHAMLDEWCQAHPQSFPPIVINITDGESTEGDPVPYVEAIQSLGTDDGPVLFFNYGLLSVKSGPVLYPAGSEEIRDDLSRLLFGMSSQLPESILAAARREGIPVQTGSRGLVCGAGANELLQMLNMLNWGQGTPRRALR